MPVRQWLVSMVALAVSSLWLPALLAEELEGLTRRIESTREVAFPHRIEYRRINVGRTGAFPITRKELERLMERCKLVEHGDAFKAFCDETCVDARNYDLPWGSGILTFDGPRVRVEFEYSTSGTQTREKDVEVCDGQRTFRKNSRQGHAQIDVEHLLHHVDANDFRHVPRISHLARSTVDEHPDVIAISGSRDRHEVEVFLDRRSLLLKEEWQTSGDNTSIVYQLGVRNVSGTAFPKFLCRARFKSDRLYKITATVIDSVKKIDPPGPDLFKMSATRGDTIVDHTRQRADGHPAVFFAASDTDDLAGTLSR